MMYVLLLLLTGLMSGLVAVQDARADGCIIGKPSSTYVTGQKTREDYCDSAQNKYVTPGTLSAGEDQTNNLVMTSGGVVRSTAIMTAVSTNTTGSVITLPTGSKSIQGILSCNAGGSTNCGITYTIYGGPLNSTTSGQTEQLCQVIIPTGAAYTSGTCPPITGNFLFVYAITTGVAGTSPSLTVTGMY